MKNTTEKQIDSCINVADTVLRHATAPTLSFDKIDVFSTRNVKEHIINLSATKPGMEFQALAESFRNALQKQGCAIESGFKLHVTLGRVNAESFTLAEIQQKVNVIVHQPITLKLNQLTYYRREDYDILGCWRLKEN